MYTGAIIILAFFAIGGKFMKTMKLFKNLFILFIFIFVFVSYMSDAFIMSTYTLISKSEVISESPKIEILEARSTNINGFVIARITNNTGSKIDNQYIKLDFFSKYDNNLGTKYLKINNLEVNESQEFKLDYKYEGVTKIIGTVVEELPDSSYEFSYQLTESDKLALFVGGLIVTYYMPARFLFKMFPF